MGRSVLFDHDVGSARRLIDQRLELLLGLVEVDMTLAHGWVTRKRTTSYTTLSALALVKGPWSIVLV